MANASKSTATSGGPETRTLEDQNLKLANLTNCGAGRRRARIIHQLVVVALLINAMAMINLPNGMNLMRPQRAQHQAAVYLTSSAFSVGRFGWPGLEWREIIDWWTSGYSRGVVIGRNYIPPCKLCDMPRMFRVDK